MALLALLSTAGAVLTGCDQRCNPTACNTLHEYCGVELRAEPNWALCANAPGEVPDKSYCSSACVASGAGEVLECINDTDNANYRSRCIDGDPAQVVQSCANRLPSAAPSCIALCDQRRTECEGKCPQTDKAECVDCAARCGLAWGRCEAECREKS